MRVRERKGCSTAPRSSAWARGPIAPPAGADMLTLVFGGLFEGWHAIIILVIALIVFGPGKLPEVFGQLGRGIREFREQAEAKPTTSVAPLEGDKRT